MKNIIIKILLLISSVSLLSAKTISFDLKYWHLSEMSYVDFIANNKDKKIFHEWLNAEPNPFTIMSNVTEEYALRSMSVFHKDSCSKDLNNKPQSSEKKTCIMLAPGTTGTFNFKQYNIKDNKDIYRTKPIMYSLNNELGIIVFDLSNKKESANSSTELELKNIDNVYEFFKKESQLKDNQIIMIGNFNATTKELEKFVDQTKYNVQMKDFTEIINNNNKLSLLDTVHVISHKNNSIVKNIKIWHNIHLLEEKNKSLNKKEELEFINSKLSNYYPISIKIEYDFKSLDFMK